MDVNFERKTALITGGGSGLGRAIAEKLLRCNAKVIALDIDAASLSDFKSEHPEIETAVADVADWEGVTKVLEGLGPIDLLVNNAGIVAYEILGDITEKCLTRVLDVNVKSIINISQVVGNGMKQRGAGAIVNVASVAGQIPCPGLMAYSVSKTAVHMITRMLTVELGPHQIRVNTVSPSFVATTAMAKTVAGYMAEVPEAFVTSFDQRHSLKRILDAEDIANAVVFLLSDRAASIHGLNVPVDNGVLAS